MDRLLTAEEITAISKVCNSRDCGTCPENSYGDAYCGYEVKVAEAQLAKCEASEAQRIAILNEEHEQILGDTENAYVIAFGSLEASIPQRIAEAVKEGEGKLIEEVDSILACKYEYNTKADCVSGCPRFTVSTCHWLKWQQLKASRGINETVLL